MSGPDQNDNAKHFHDNQIERALRIELGTMSETAEQISKQPEVREALDQTRGKKVKARPTDKFWFVSHALLLVGCGILYYLLAAHFVPLPQPMLIY